MDNKINPPKLQRIVITSGEPAGIGPEISVMALKNAVLRWPGVAFTILGNKQLLAQRALAYGYSINRLPSTVSIIDYPLLSSCKAGVLNVKNASYVLSLLDAAIDGALNKEYDSVVTAPIQKSVIDKFISSSSSIPNPICFTGHTEYLAQRTKTDDVVMMLTSTHLKPLRVALATTHIPLAAVPAALSQNLIFKTLKIIDENLKQFFGLPKPKILVTGLNPHAGEQGHLGREEEEIIIPAINKALSQRIDAQGPLPADTIFQPKYLNDADCILTMYHDQGLPVLKHMSFGQGVNITLGLPIIRTSVDHGTALTLAGKNLANCESLISAIDCAVSMAKHKANLIS